MVDVEGRRQDSIRRTPSNAGELVTQKQVELAIKRLRDFLLKALASKEEILKKLDVNGNGEISLEEFDGSLKDLGCPVDELCGNVSLKRIFKNLDVDGSNTLSIKELMITNPWKAEEEAVHLLRKALLEQFPTKPELFAAFDEDRNGSISYGELEKSLRTYGICVESATGFDLGRIFDFLDVDCSGELSKQELLESDPRQASRERDDAIVKFREILNQKWSSKDTMMKALDTNGNGQLSFVELQGGLQRNQVSMHEILKGKDFKWFFRVLDVDSSGQISIHELLDLDPAQEAVRMGESRRRRRARGKLDKETSQQEKSLEDKYKKLKAKSRELETDRNSMGEEMSELRAANTKLQQDQVKIQNENESFRKAYSKLQQDYEQLQEEKAHLLEAQKNNQTDLELKYKALQDDHGRILSEHERLVVEHRLLKEDHVQLTNKHKRLRVSLKTDWDTLSNDNVKHGTIDDGEASKDAAMEGAANRTAGDGDVEVAVSPSGIEYASYGENSSQFWRQPLSTYRFARDTKGSQKRAEPHTDRRRRPVSAFPSLSADHEKSMWRLPSAIDDRPNSSAGLRNRLAFLRGHLSYVNEASDKKPNSKYQNSKYQNIHHLSSLELRSD